MKTKLFLYSIIIITLSRVVLAQDSCDLPNPMFRNDVPSTQNYSDVEIRIYNQTRYNYYLHNGSEIPGDVKVIIIPVGGFFNVDNKYSPKAIAINTHTIAGKEIIIPAQTSNLTPSYISGNYDPVGGGDTSESEFFPPLLVFQKSLHLRF